MPRSLSACTGDLMGRDALQAAIQAHRDFHDAMKAIAAQAADDFRSELGRKMPAVERDPEHAPMIDHPEVGP